MIFEKDWFVRQISQVISAVGRTVFKRDRVEYEMRIGRHRADTDKLYARLQELIVQRRLCEAEDLLFESLDETNENYLELALDFYRSLNELTDEELEANNFSRPEIAQGLDAVLRRFDLETYGFALRQE